MTDTTWHPYSERRPTALERAAERYREAWQAHEAAHAAWRAQSGDLVAVEDALDDAFAAREATADALLEAARGER